MKVVMVKTDGFWHLEVNGNRIRTPFRDTEPRKTVVGYAGRSFPGAAILDGSE
jgi:hypothetical protein